MSTAASPQDSHVIVTPDQIKWGPAPPSLPTGSQMAVLEGDPSKAGSSFTIRARMPNGYTVPPHSHPTDENIIVLKGTFMLGLGDKLDKTAGNELRVGSYARMPQGMRHSAWAKGETIIQVYGIGPFEVNYVNAADDPRNKPGK
ncbi:MAG: cupin domain-containing protein [Acidobacteria bacterium]|nr:cupin domain-containing protein [Acidobacteriota bacterium]